MSEEQNGINEDEPCSYSFKLPCARAPRGVRPSIPPDAMSDLCCAQAAAFNHPPSMQGAGMMHSPLHISPLPRNAVQTTGPHSPNLLMSPSLEQGGLGHADTGRGLVDPEDNEELGQDLEDPGESGQDQSMLDRGDAGEFGQEQKVLGNEELEEPDPFEAACDEREAALAAAQCEGTSLKDLLQLRARLLSGEDLGDALDDDTRRSVLAGLLSHTNFP